MSNKFTGLLFPLIMLKTLVLLLIIGASCSGTPFWNKNAKSHLLITDKVNVYYDLNEPDEKLYLPYSLTEISGLAFLGEDRVLCVEDEMGKVYEYDLKQRKIINEVIFDGPGDFEGVEIVENTVYALRSDGDIYAFEYSQSEKAVAVKHETELGSSNDAEGFCYNPYTGNLLIACKEDEDLNGGEASGKAVYEFYLKNKKIIEKPFFDITTDDLIGFFEDNREGDHEKDRIKFKPSGIAYNPVDGYFYVLASVGKLLVVLSKKGEIKATYPIAPRILGQPEGICFAENGDLYISSEGQGFKGYLLKFMIKKK